MRLKFVEPVLPTLVQRPPEGSDWIHEIKFDGYLSQIVIDDDVRIFTRNGLNWTTNIAGPPPKGMKRPARRNGSSRGSSGALSTCAARKICEQDKVPNPVDVVVRRLVDEANITEEQARELIALLGAHSWASLVREARELRQAGSSSTRT